MACKIEGVEDAWTKKNAQICNASFGYFCMSKCKDNWPLPVKRYKLWSKRQLHTLVNDTVCIIYDFNDLLDIYFFHYLLYGHTPSLIIKF